MIHINLESVCECYISRSDKLWPRHYRRSDVMLPRHALISSKLSANLRIFISMTYRMNTTILCVKCYE